MNNEMYEIMKDKRGFIAALDQSGGSSSKTLKAYGIPETAYNTEEEMFDLIHEMRKRVFTSKSFTNEHIIGAILFEKTMLSKVNGEFTADYLWNEKKIVSFLKVDKGLAEQNNGVKLMKPIPELETELKEAVEKHVFGTKMRSVIYEPNVEGIKAIVAQQFEFAKTICDAGLVPIIEPEVDINAPEKEKCEEILKAEIIEKLKTWNKEDKIMFKFTIPTIANHYLDLYDYECVVIVRKRRLAFARAAQAVRIGGFRLDAVWIDIVRIVRVRAPQRVLPRRFHARKLGVVPVYLRLFLPVYAVERLL